MDLKETDILGDHVAEHWYYRSKAKAMLQLLAPTEASVILDVGAGSGFFSRHLLERTAATTAWCVDPCYGDDVDAEEAGKSLRLRRSVTAIDADLVLLMDVLEHVDDDVGLIREYAAKVPAGCRFLISVPAFNFLWSEHDEFLEHRRRYDLRRLREVVVRAGLRSEREVYYFGGVFPLAATIRLLGNRVRKDDRPPRSQLRRHHPMVNELLAAISSLELLLMRRNRIAGLTAFCLAQKPT